MKKLNKQLKKLNLTATDLIRIGGIINNAKDHNIPKRCLFVPSWKEITNLDTADISNYTHEFVRDTDFYKITFTNAMDKEWMLSDISKVKKP